MKKEENIILNWYEKMREDKPELKKEFISEGSLLYWLAEKQLTIPVVSSSYLVDMAEQMQKENQVMIKGAKGHDSLAYYKGIDLGIDRIIRLIKRNYC